MLAGGASAKLAAVSFTLADKIEAEQQFREFLHAHDLPEPDAVEYGFNCVRFYHHESRTCVVFDLDPDAVPDEDDLDLGLPSG